ncbi:MAG: serine--tRNA ligase [Candidatus Brennerbacteria bacterium]|nr:serine--tRNA ligase [Candidatus Brennerbacteria bacterium]
MLDVEFIRQNPDQVKEGIAAKNIDPKLVDKFLKLDNDWRVKVVAVDHLRSEQNTVTAEMKKSKASDVISRAQIIKKQLTSLEKSMAELEKKRWSAWSALPNLPLPEVIRGKSDKENTTAKEAGNKKEFNFIPKDYLVLSEVLKIIDVKRAAKVSGSRFGYFFGDAALLEFALIDFVLKTLLDEKIISAIAKENNLKISAKPFIPVIPPVLINRESMWGMGYADRGAEEIYSLEKDGLFLVGTSEQSIGAMHQGETFKEQELPLRYVGFSSCFRREAGSYGKDTKGILRVHQFDKLEMFSFVSPENSKNEHKLILGIEEYLMSKLEIPYRVLNICTGDLGDSAAAKYDIEAWLPGQNNGKGEYRETHSTSNTTDFQARRLNIKYASEVFENGKKPSPKFVHMLNGTAFAIGRAIIAIMENYQTVEGFIKIPEVLKPFFGFKLKDGGEYFIRPPEF